MSWLGSVLNDTVSSHTLLSRFTWGLGWMSDERRSSQMAHGVSFDRTISLGHVLTIMSIVFATIGGYVTYRLTIAEHEARLQNLEQQMAHQVLSDSDLRVMMYNIRQDVAVIRDRVERSSKLPP